MGILLLLVIVIVGFFIWAGWPDSPEEKARREAEQKKDNELSEKYAEEYKRALGTVSVGQVFEGTSQISDKELERIFFGNDGTIYYYGYNYELWCAVIRPRDIIKIELREDTMTFTNKDGAAAGAILGGALLGPIGAIGGALAGRDTRGEEVYPIKLGIEIYYVDMEGYERHAECYFIRKRGLHGNDIKIAYDKMNGVIANINKLPASVNVERTGFNTVHR